MKKKLLSFGLLAAGLLTAGNVMAGETTTTLEQKGQVTIAGTSSYEKVADSVLYLNSYAALGGAGAISFTLPEDFDASKVVSATLKMYVNAKANRDRSGNINFYALEALPDASYLNLGDSYTSKSSEDGNSTVYQYGTAKTKRYAYSGDTIASVAHSAASGSYMKSSTYNDVNLSNYIKSLTSVKGGSTIYIGVSITDFAADTYIAGYGSKHPIKLEIVTTDETMVTYSINYTLDGTTTVYTQSDNVVENTTVNAESYITVDETSYVVVADETPSLTVTSSNYTLDVPVRNLYTAKATINYTIGGETSKEEITLTETTGKDCTYYITWPKYKANAAGTYYLCDSETFGVTGTFTNGQELSQSVSYSTADEDIVWFGEAEDGGVYPSEFNSSYSGGYTAARSGDNATNRGLNIGSLSAGSYIFVANITADGARGLVLRDGSFATTSEKENTLFTTTTTTGLVKVNFTIDSNLASVYLNGKTNISNNSVKLNQSATYDYALVRKAATAETITCGSYTYKSYCSENPLEFAENGDYMAYTATYTADNGNITVTLDKCASVPAKTGVIIYNKNGKESSDIAIGTATSTENDNALVGVLVDTPLTQTTDEGYTNFFLSTEGEFIKVQAAGGTLGANRAYLPIKTSDLSANSKVTIVFADDATGINEVNAAAKSGKIYNLQGIEVKNATNGLYIVNGKKVIK